MIYIPKSFSSNNILERSNFEIRINSNYCSVLSRSKLAYEPKVNFGLNTYYKYNLNRFLFLQTGLGVSQKGIVKVYTERISWDRYTNSYVYKQLEQPELDPEKGFGVNIPIGIGLTFINKESFRICFALNYVRSFNYFPSKWNNSDAYALKDKNQVLLSFPISFLKSGIISVIPEYSISLNKIKFTNDTYRYFFVGLSVGCKIR